MVGNLGGQGLAWLFTRALPVCGKNLAGINIGWRLNYISGLRYRPLYPEVIKKQRVMVSSTLIYGLTLRLWWPAYRDPKHGLSDSLIDTSYHNCQVFLCSLFMLYNLAFWKKNLKFPWGTCQVPWGSIPGFADLSLRSWIFWVLKTWWGLEPLWILCCFSMLASSRAADHPSYFLIHSVNGDNTLS